MSWLENSDKDLSNCGNTPFYMLRYGRLYIAYMNVLCSGKLLQKLIITMFALLCVILKPSCVSYIKFSLFTKTLKRRLRSQVRLVGQRSYNRLSLKDESSKIY